MNEIEELIILSSPRRRTTMKKPNVIQTVLAVAACKLTRFVLRKTGRGGTAIPGIVAMKIAKNILAAVSEGMNIIVVTGTNGKTTTCNMIEHALTSAGCDCLRDKAGANMLNGIASDLISNADWLGKPRHPYAVLECDEAALKLVVPFVKPKVIVITNIFSDQVDRFGSVRNTLKEIRKGVRRSPDSVLVLNADDPLTASLALASSKKSPETGEFSVIPNQVLRYGLEGTVGTQGKVDLSDAGKCICCGGEYQYSHHIYATLGGFICTKCGYRRQTPDVAVITIDQMSTSGSRIHLKADDKILEAEIALPAVYNIYNAAAAIAAVKAAGLPAQKAIDSLSDVRSAFGRMETFDLAGNRIQMILVKNPAGCNQALTYVTGFNEDYTVAHCLNNQTGDGHDISWIYDTDYERLVSDPHLKKIYVGGECRDELYARLKAAGAPEDLMEITTDYQDLVGKLKDEGRPVFALPNYTAMMELRQAISQETGSGDFWE